MNNGYGAVDGLGQACHDIQERIAAVLVLAGRLGSRRTTRYGAKPPGIDRRRLRPDVRIATQNRCGKGNVIACGFTAETGDITAIVDAGIQPIRLRSRGSSMRFLMVPTLRRKLGSRKEAAVPESPVCAASGPFFRTAFNTCCGARYTDLCYGFKHLLAQPRSGSRSSPLVKIYRYSA